MGFKLISVARQTTIGGRNSMNKFIKTGRNSFSGIQVVEFGCGKEGGGSSMQVRPRVCTPNAKLSLCFNFSSEFKAPISKTQLAEKTSQFWTNLNVCFYSR